MKHSHTFRLNKRKKSQGFWVFITVWQVFKPRGNRYSSYLFIMTSCGCLVTYIAGLKNSPLIKLKRRKSSHAGIYVARKRDNGGLTETNKVKSDE